MYIKYTSFGDKVFMNIPESSHWEIRFRMLNERGDDYNLYLIIDDNEIELRDTEHWCQGRPSLPYEAVGNLYEDIVDAVANRLAADRDLRVIDIDAIEHRLLENKYEKLWLERGYVKPDKNGRW